MKDIRSTRTFAIFLLIHKTLLAFTSSPHFKITVLDNLGIKASIGKIGKNSQNSYFNLKNFKLF